MLQTRQAFKCRVIRLEFFGEQPDCLIHKPGLSRQMLWVTINSRLESCARIDIMLTILVVLILTPEEIRHLHARTNVATLVLRRYAQSHAQNVFNRFGRLTYHMISFPLLIALLRIDIELVELGAVNEAEACPTFVRNGPRYFKPHAKRPPSREARSVLCRTDTDWILF